MSNEVYSHCPACQAAVPAGAETCVSCGLAFYADSIPNVDIGTTSKIGVPDVGERHYLARALDSEEPIAKVGAFVMIAPVLLAGAIGLLVVFAAFVAIIAR